MKFNTYKFINNLLIIIALLTIENTAFAQAPTITSFSPDSGSIGALVTVVGTNLNNLDTIKIGGVSAIKVSATSTSLKAMVMPGAKTGSIYLKNSSGNLTSGYNFNILVNEPPIIQQGNKLTGTGNIGTTYQGRAISLSADGNTAIVGGVRDNTDQGAVWVYTRNIDVWTQQGNKLIGTGNFGSAFFGSSTRLSADGNTAIIGGEVDSNYRGSAWIFVRNGGIWSQQGNKLVGIGASKTERFGRSVSISADGNTAIIKGIEAIWFFTRTGTVWNQQGNKIVGNLKFDSFDERNLVDLSADGNTAIVGGIFTDSIGNRVTKIFRRNGGIWSPQESIPIAGNSVSISADGNTVLAGIYAGYGANCYIRIGGVWVQQGNKLEGTGSIGAEVYQGCAVSLSADGNTAVLGAYKDDGETGAAWVFKRIGGIWTQQGSKLVGTGSFGTSSQGNALSISADGNTFILGGQKDNSFQGGAIWVFSNYLATNANLNSMTINTATLVPAFSTNTTSYSATTTLSNITLTPTSMEPNSIIQIRINGGNYSMISSRNTSSLLALNSGSNTLEVKVTAQNGIQIKIYTIVIFSSPLKPTITSFNPSSGTVGSLVTITGTNLNKPDTLVIGGKAASIISATNNKLVAMVMPEAITGVIYVANNYLNETTSTNFIVTPSLTPIFQQGNKLVGTGSLGLSEQGNSVSISADGNTAIVGGVNENWIYIRNNGAWSQQGIKLIGTDGQSSYDGACSVSISADGNTVAVGKFGDNYYQGAVWVFVRNDTNWIQQGSKLLCSGNIGAAHLGNSVSISADGNTIIVGGYFDKNNQGAVWIFTRSGGVWSQQGNKLVGTQNIGAAKQGTSVSISADGNTAIVGGYVDNSNQGAVWIFTRSAGIWSQQGSKLVGTGNVGAAEQGTAVSISADGNTAIVGGLSDSIGQGAVWVYSRSAGIWSQQDKLVGTGNIGAARQGESSISADGNTAIVGGSRDNNTKGAIWIYKRINGIWAQQGSKIIGSGKIGTFVYQGSSVSMSADGNTAIFGGPNDSNQMGAAWILNSNIPVITSINLMVAFSSCIGIQSIPQSFTISGNNLSDTIFINSPSGFEISKSIGNGYDSSLKLVPNLGIVNNTTIFVRMLSGNTGTLLGDIVCTTSNANTQNICVSGKISKPNIGNIIGNSSPNSIISPFVYSISSQTNSTYNWTATNGTIQSGQGTNTVNIVWQSIGTEILKAKITNNDGCIDSTILPIKITNVGVYELNNTFSNINFKPNPFSSQIEIGFMSNTKEITQLIIVDAIGKLVFSKNLDSNIGNNTFTIDELTSLKSGIYFARLANNNGLSRSFKLIKN